MVARLIKTLAACCLLLALGGCSSLLFYPEPGQPITPTAAGLDYRDVTLTAADFIRVRMRVGTVAAATTEP